MRQNSNILTVAAYGRLLEYSANKRYGLLENSFINNEVDKLALEFNESIKIRRGLDIVELEDLESILSYETLVDEELTDFTYKYIIVEDKSDEGQLLSSSYQLTNEFFKNKGLSVDEETKRILKLFSIPLPTLIAYCKTPHAVFASNWGEDEPQQLFLNSLIRLKGKERLLFAHIIKLNPELDRKLNAGWQIVTVGLFVKDEYKILKDNPIKLFLKIINNYGLDFEIDNIKKRFIYKLSIPKTGPVEDIKFKVEPPNNPYKKEPFRYQMLRMETTLGFYINCAYVFRYELLSKDALSGKI